MLLTEWQGCGLQGGNPVICIGSFHLIHTYRHRHTQIHTQVEQKHSLWGSRCDVILRVQCFLINETTAVRLQADIGLSSCQRPHQTVPWLHNTGNEQHTVYENCPESCLPNYWPKHEFHVCHWQSGSFHTRFTSVPVSLNTVCIFAFMCALLGYVGQVWHFEFQINQGF